MFFLTVYKFAIDSIEKVEETAGEVNAVIEEGMMLRRRLLDA